MKKVLLWLRIIRPQTLFASFVPVAVGLIATLANASDRIIGNGAVIAVTFICALALQILSNLINDWYDFERGTDKAGRAGFKRALAEGEVSKREMAVAIALTAIVCIGTGLYLVINGGLPILLIGASALLFAWLYTATSYSLSYLGIADIFVLLYYGVIASSGTAYLLTHSFVPKAFWAGAVSGLISMCVLMINNLRDIDNDRSTGKRSIPVRFGKRAAELIMLLEVLIMPLAAYLAFGLAWPMCILLPALLLLRKVWKAQGPQYNMCLLMTGLLNAFYLILCLLSFA